ncbi:hypothetical protein VN97_g10086 [Penicillium thymicola]|uniref:Transmembrane protein n=1 Tax=Penicillium thymicola TaxID=293382 RepID=A0AAI9T9P1_PENTH|nr:hypothetical protein VN97_g10086 [Penicillium thymicola]
MVITPSTLTINQSGIGVAFGASGVLRVRWVVITPSTLTTNLVLYWRCFGASGVSGVLGAGWMVITPSTLTINQSGIGVVWCFVVLRVVFGVVFVLLVLLDIDNGIF